LIRRVGLLESLALKSQRMRILRIFVLLTALTMNNATETEEIESVHIGECFSCLLTGDCAPECKECWDINCENGSTIKCIQSVFYSAVNQFSSSANALCESTTTVKPEIVIEETSTLPPNEEYSPGIMDDSTKQEDNPYIFSKFMNSSTLFFILLTVSILIWSKVAMAYLLCTRGRAISRDRGRPVTSDERSIRTNGDNLQTPLPINGV